MSMIRSVISIKQHLTFFTILALPPSPPPWFIEQIRQMINNKNEVYRQYIHNGRLQQLQHLNSTTSTSNSLRDALKILKGRIQKLPKQSF